MLFLLVFVFGAQAQKAECDKYSDASLGISFCAPTDWTVGTIPGKSSVMTAETRDNFTPNINVRSAVLKAKPAGATKVELESQTAFTAGRAQGIKAVFSVEYQGLDIRTIQYYFSGRGETKIIITATILLSQADELESDIDDAIRTFEVR